jgi:dTDP-4-dehydrorhamnose 3,5-epimerase
MAHGNGIMRLPFQRKSGKVRNLNGRGEGFVVWQSPPHRPGTGFMKFTQTEIPEIILIEPRVFGDSRGFFMETYHFQMFAEAGIAASFLQDNQSGSQQGTLRGLHYQIRQAQGKLVRVVVGEVFDVAVDIRRGSPTFGQWVGMLLSAENKRQLWVPPGFAHGFYVTSAWAELTYKVTDYYAPEWECGIRWDDPELAVDWPLVEGKPPILSARDAGAKPFREAELFDQTEMT